MKPAATTVSLIAFSFSLAIACMSAPKLPDPILGLDGAAANRIAVIEGMARRGWVIEEEAEGRVLARLHRRRHVAKVWVDYSGRQIAFRYGGSEGLGCIPSGDACSSIHASYNKWARNLALDIAAEITGRRALGPPPAGPTPGP